MNLVSTYTTAIIVNVYFSVVIGAKKDTMEKLYWFYHVYSFGVSLLASIFTVQFNIGPMGMWCWITCPWEGVEDISGMNPGLCWT